MSTSWKTVRVFISSTFRDMQAERDWLVRFVFPKLREELLPRRIHLVDVDLRWGVTSDQDALGVCREVIDECRPRFMGILGGRYGWVPAGRDESITADEVHYGVLDREAEQRGRSFFYFRHDDATAQIEEETPGDFREPDGSDAANKLAALKQSIAEADLPVFIYPAKWDAAQKRLTGLEAFGNRVHADLLQSLKGDPELTARFAGDSTAPPDEFAEEAEQMEAFIEERTERYVIGSREPLLREMLAIAAAADGAPNIFVLTGDPGSGKSALLAKFTRELAGQPSGIPQSVFVIPHFVGASTGSTDLRRTLRRLCHELARAAGNAELLPLDIKDLVTHFQELFAEAATKQRVILVFDALNHFDATDGAHWLNWLPRELPPGVSIVTSVIAPAEGQPEHQTLAILRLRPGTRIEKLKPLAEADTLEIIEGFRRRYAKRLSSEQIAALLAKPEGRLPLYVLTALEELRTLGTHREITARIHDLPGDARALFGWILTERLARDPGFRDREGRPCGAALVEKFAACLGVSRHGLSPAELTALLDPGDPLGNVAALLRLLRPYLMRRGELLDFYHGQFREAAEAAYLGTPEKLRAAHHSVAACLQAFADPHRDGQCRDATPHSLSELPHHQTSAEAWPDLITTLENIFFLEAKVTHGMAFDLAMDFTTAVDALPSENAELQRLRLLDEALRRDIHFVARHAQGYPQALFQCFWNACWWYDSPQTEQFYSEGDVHSAEDIAVNREALRLHELMEAWRRSKQNSGRADRWIRSLRPPEMSLGSPQIAVLRGHRGGISKVVYSSDGTKLASAAADNLILIWNAMSGGELTRLQGHTKQVDAIAFSFDGSRLVSSSPDKTVRLWDANSGTQLFCRSVSRLVHSVAFAPNGKSIALACSDEVIRCLDSANGSEICCLHGHEAAVRDVAYSPDGTRLVSASHDTTLRIWDATTGCQLACLRGHKYSVQSASFSNDGHLVVSTSDGHKVRVWDALSGSEVFCLLGSTFNWSDEEDWYYSPRFSPDTSLVAAGSREGAIVVWGVASKAIVGSYWGHESSVITVTFSPNGKRIASGSADGTVRIWRVDGYHSGQVAVRLKNHKSPIWSLAFSPSGERCATGSYDQRVFLWNPKSGQIVRTLHGHDGVVSAVCFSYDERSLASASEDGAVFVWNATTGSRIAQLRGQEGNVTALAFARDSRWLLTVVSVPSRLQDATCDVRELLSGKVPFNEVVKFAATFTLVSIWDLGSMKLHATLLCPAEQKVDSVAVSSNGQNVVIETSDGLTWKTGIPERGGKQTGEWSRNTPEKVKELRSLHGIQYRTDALETMIMSLDNRNAVAWWPNRLSPMEQHPDGRAWAGAVGKHLCFIILEQDVPCGEVIGSPR